RTDKQCTLRQTSAEFGELLRVLQEFDDFLQLDFGFVSSGNIGKRDFGRVTAQQFCLALAERERLVAASLHLAEQENPESDEQEIRQHGDEQAAEIGTR